MARTQVTGEEILDSTVEKIDLADDLSSAIYQVKSAGWSNTPLDKANIVEEHNVAIATKFERQSGFIKHSGFIKGNA